MNQGCDVTGDLTHRRPRTIQLCHPVTDKLIFTKSCNYLHIRKNPLLDDVFGNFRSPVNLETQEDKLHIDKQYQFTTANSHQGRLPKVRNCQPDRWYWKRYRPSFELSPQSQQCCTQNLKIDCSGWTDLIDAGILISNGLVWWASSDGKRSKFAYMMMMCYSYFLKRLDCWVDMLT